MTDRIERAPSAFRINLEQQKNRAKELLRAVKAGDAEALSRFAAACSGSEIPDSLEAPQVKAKLADAQFVIARELRFASWAKLKAHIAAMERQRAAIDGKLPAPDGDLKTLHIRCGHDIQQPLVDAGFVGDFLVDALPYGTMALTSGPAHLERFARELTPGGKSIWGNSYEEVLADLQHVEQQLEASADDYERVVIWMEHDTFDQLVLAKLLAHYATAKQPRILELIAVDEFPGGQRFLGIGQLPPEALRLLWPTRNPITPAQLALGQDVWIALHSADPRLLATLARSGTPALPIMAPALLRHLSELPSVANGLRLSEQLLLEILSNHDSVRRIPLYARLQLRDPLPYNSDLAYFGLLDYMLAASAPLVTVVRTDLDERQFRIDVSITDLGRAVLRGDRDWLSFHPPSRWLGGVHIQPGLPCWRWNESKRDAVFRES
jgi:hypothetical protein